MYRALLLLFLSPQIASAAALTAWGSLQPQTRSTVPACMLTGKGQGSNLIYAYEVDQTLGALPVEGLGTAGTDLGGVLTIQGDPAGTPIPISGSITANNASVAPTGAAVPAQATYAGMNVSGNLTGLTGTGNGLKVDVQASVLPTGAATSAKQPALGTAGTASADVLTVQGIASMTPLLVNGSGSTQPVSGTVTASNFPSTVDVNTGAVGASTIRTYAAGRTIGSSIPILFNNSNSGANITTSAYVQLASAASNTVAVNTICMANTSGSIIKFATGTAASEVDRLYLPPGGSGCWNINIASSTRLALEALDATASTGYILDEAY